MLAHNVWNMDVMKDLDLTEVFNDLLDDPTLLTMDSYYMKMLERFVVLQYSSTCNASSLNEARTRLFSKKTSWFRRYSSNQECIFRER